MFPTLTVWVDDQAEPTVIDTTSLDFWTYEELVAKQPNGKTSEHGMRLTVAFIHLNDRDPKNLEEVKLWARAHKARVLVGDAVDPTQRAATGDSSSELP